VRRTFLRIYAGLVASMLALLLVLIVGVQMITEPPALRVLERLTLPLFSELAEKIARTGPGAAREAALARWEVRFDAPLRLRPRAEAARLGPGPALPTGGDAVSFLPARRELWLYAGAGGGEVLVLGPVEAERALLAGVAFGLGTAAVAAAALAALFVVPLQRQLTILANAARRFGRGDLDARARLPRRDALGELASVFNRTAERLAGLVRGREELLAALSHDLRTPVSRLRFGLEMLESGGAAKRERLAEGMRSDLGELEALAEELQEALRLESGSGAVRPRELDVRAVAQRVLREASQLREDVTLALREGELAPPVQASLDERRLERALRNLLRNALAHARSRVELGVCAKGADVEIRVEDDGPGVPYADRERVFEPFVRLESARPARTALAGSGLGLALVRRIAEAHGGSVGAEGSAALGGAAFVLRLPKGCPGDGPVA